MPVVASKRTSVAFSMKPLASSVRHSPITRSSQDSTGRHTEQTNNKEKASRETHTQETAKLTKENSTGKTQMEMCRV
jgi:hypothetical protein